MSGRGFIGFLCGGVVGVILAVSAYVCFSRDINTGEVVRNFNDGSSLVCQQTQHNAWYFTWKAGWFNDLSYSYTNCHTGKRA